MMFVFLRVFVLVLVMPNTWSTGVSTQPTIDSLYPNSVHKGWEGLLRVKGTNFDKRSFALIDGSVPKTTYINENLIEVELTKDITRLPGSKRVKVHTGGGGLSNVKILLVRETTTQE